MSRDKICSKCGLRKSKELFAFKKESPDGHQALCKECNRALVREWKQKNKDREKQNNKNWQSANKDRAIFNNKKWYQANVERDKNRCKEWRNKNKKRINETSRNRRKTDVLFRLKSSLRTRLWWAIKNNHKTGSAVGNLGCTIEEFKVYLESLFQPGMTWDNWAKDGWHIDHIAPLCRFDLTNPEEFKKACHYSNLQPLWCKENLSKNK